MKAIVIAAITLINLAAPGFAANRQVTGSIHTQVTPTPSADKGQVQHQDFHFTKLYDKASPVLAISK